MAKVEEEHSFSRSVDAGIHDVRHKFALTTVLKSGGVSDVRSTYKRNISGKYSLCSLTETLHCPLTCSVDRLGRCISTDEHDVTVVSIAVLIVVSCSPIIRVFRIVARACPVYTRIIITCVPCTYICSETDVWIYRMYSCRSLLHKVMDVLCSELHPFPLHCSDRA